MRPEYLLININNLDDAGVRNMLELFGRDHRFMVIGESEKTYKLDNANFICSKIKLKNGTSLFRLPPSGTQLRFYF